MLRVWAAEKPGSVLEEESDCGFLIMRDIAKLTLLHRFFSRDCQSCRGAGSRLYREMSDFDEASRHYTDTAA